MLSSTDLWFSAFLLSKGHEVAKYDVIGRGKARFYFDIDEEKWKEYKLEFNQSEICNFRNLIERLKDLCY